MKWPLIVIIAYYTFNTILNWYYAGSRKSIPATVPGAVLATAWGAFVVWAVAS